MGAVGYLMVAAVLVMAVVVALAVAAQRTRDDGASGRQPGRTPDCPIPSGIECPFHEPSLRGTCRRCRREAQAQRRAGR